VKNEMKKFVIIPLESL